MTTYYIDQKVTALANQYKVFEGVSGRKGNLVAFVHQKRLALRENILFYANESKSELAFQLKARNIVELAGAYEVFDANDRLIGSLKKNFKSSLIRSTWQVWGLSDKEPLAKVQERSLLKALLRRIWDFLPILGEVIPFPLKYHFDFVCPKTNQLMGSYDKVALIYDHYKLEVDDKFLKQTDWRVLVAMGVALDALQSR